MKNRITPCPWFDREAEEAARFYASIFPHSRIGAISCYGDGAPPGVGRMMQAMMGMIKLDIVALEKAYAGQGGGGR